MARWLVWGLLSIACLLMLLILLLRFVNPPTTSFMLGYQIENRWQADVRHQWVPLTRISPWMPLAVIASEDQRFLSHWGLDLEAIAAALADFRSGDGLRGASTITQQTSKNLFLWSGRSYLRKGMEAVLALALEGLWPKRRILEVYLNVAEFGPGIYGVEAASQAHFGVSAAQLNPVQAARLAAVLPNPKVFDARAPSAYLLGRVDWIRQQMSQLGGRRLVSQLY